MPLTCLLYTSLDRLNKYEEGIRICTEAIELAQEQGQKAKESELLFTLGQMCIRDRFFFLCQKLFYLAGGYLVAFAGAAQVEVLFP